MPKRCWNPAIIHWRIHSHLSRVQEPRSDIFRVMSSLLKHYGWPVSPYSAKTRAYLQFKRIPFSQVYPSLWYLRFRIQKAVGAAIMPTVRLNNGTWLQDSSHIIDELEALHPNPSIHPSGAKQKLFSYLIELHGDEWLPMVALHYRWHLKENKAFALQEFKRYGLPWSPYFLSTPLVLPIAKKMQSYLPALGVTDKTIPALEHFTQTLLNNLDNHFQQHRYLFGDRPSIGDFALFGPIWAHLYRDPGSTFLFNKVPQVKEWMERLLDPSPFEGNYLPEDQVPETLFPILRCIFRDQIPWIQTLRTAINQWCEANPQAKRVPRSLGFAEFSIGNATERRKLITFVQWKAQRAWASYENSTSEEKVEVDQFLLRLGLPNPFIDSFENPLVRHNFKPFLANAAR